MGIVSNNAPAWYNEKEASCFEEVRSLARSIPSAKALVVENIPSEERVKEDGAPACEEHNQVLIECIDELSNEDVLRIVGFNREGHALLVSFVYESEYVEGKRYGI